MSTSRTEFLYNITVTENKGYCYGGKVSCRRGQGLFFLFIALCRMQNPTTSSMARKRHFASGARGFSGFCLFCWHGGRHGDDTAQGVYTGSCLFLLTQGRNGSSIAIYFSFAKNFYRTAIKKLYPKWHSPISDTVFSICFVVPPRSWACRAYPSQSMTMTCAMMTRRNIHSG